VENAGDDRIAFTLLDRPHATRRDDRVVEDLVVPGDRPVHLVVAGVPQPRRALHVGEQERHGRVGTTTGSSAQPVARRGTTGGDRSSASSPTASAYAERV